MNSILNIAILAHVDAGKTTLTEQLLFHSGTLKEAGNVDKGTATTDYLQVEKDRGISVLSSHVSIHYKNLQINIIDTPGHADFISEVERSLMAVDIVVLMISAADGVQAQTRVLWRILEKMNIPRIVLVNKIDRSGVIISDVLEEISKELTNNTVILQQLKNEGTTAVNIEDKYSIESLVEFLAEYDDNILESFLNEEEIPVNQLEEVYKEEVLKANVFPILFSVTKVGIGINDLLQELEKLNPNLISKSDEKLSAIVFKISHHPKWGKLSHIRLFSGSLNKKQTVFNQTLNKEEKINLLKKVFSNKLEDVEHVGHGDVVAITGFTKSKVGDVLGEINYKTAFTSLSIPLLTVQVKPKTEQDYIKLADALLQLSVEDPLLGFQWFKDEKEFHLNINGWIQIEILTQILMDRYQIEAEFLSPTVIYKETPITSGFGYEAYTMPKPCWAVIKFNIEPGKRGSGISYSSNVGVNDILLKYQKEVERTIDKALKQGVKGWEVTDLRITLIGGEDHVIHSRAGDFVIATPMAIMNGLQEIGTHILEPIMNFVIHGPEDILGQITSDLVQMRGEFEQPEMINDKMILKGRVPAATSLDYPVKLASRTGGRASIQMTFDSYEKVDENLAVIREFKGINPLDRAKYILKARKAIQ